MKRGDIVEGKVTRIDFPNIGIIECEGREIQVKNTLPGQLVKIQIQKARKSKTIGRPLEIISKSDIETREEVCKHFGKCGGCLYGTIDYDTQLKIKHEQIKRLLQPVIEEERLSSIDEGIVPSPLERQYRNKMEFSFGDAYINGPLSLGMHKRGSFYDIETVDGCMIVDEDFRTILKETLVFFQKKEIPFYHRKSCKGILRHLLVRKAHHTGEILIDLVTTSQDMDESIIEEWREKIVNLQFKGELKGILHTINDRNADVVEDNGTTILYGEDHFTEKLLGLTFKITPFSFFQTNSLGAEVLYETVKEMLPVKRGILYDLYSGTGTIAQILSTAVDKCIGVEIVEEAVLAARENAKRNGIENCEFIAGDVLKVLDDIEILPDTIVLDPPRDGVNPKALKKILSYGVKHILYISCKATSLARDIPAFAESGYSPMRIKSVDMFPDTGNVEVICLFSNLK